MPPISATIKINKTFNLVKTDEIRQPKLGEFYYCHFCDKIELCVRPYCCGEGEIYKVDFIL